MFTCTSWYRHLTLFLFDSGFGPAIVELLQLPIWGDLVLVAATFSLSLACLPACSRPSGLCNNSPSLWSFPQASLSLTMPCNRQGEGTFGRNSHHPLQKCQPLPLVAVILMKLGGFLWPSSRTCGIILEVLIFKKKSVKKEK